jgi:hypothetical protein
MDDYYYYDSNESIESNEEELSNNEEIINEYLQSLRLTIAEGKKNINFLIIKYRNYYEISPKF